MKWWVCVVLWIVGVIVVFVVVGVIFWNVSFWFGVWIICFVFDFVGLYNVEIVVEYVFDDIYVDFDFVYDEFLVEGWFDVFCFVDVDVLLLIIFWVYGGVFIVGQKELLWNYFQVFVLYGFIVVNVEYIYVFEVVYLMLICQVDCVIDYVVVYVEKFGVDLECFVFVGDFVGVYIVVQLVMVIVQFDYVEVVGLLVFVVLDQFCGVVLFSGFYDFIIVDYDNDMFGFFMCIVMWLYFGMKFFFDVEEFCYMVFLKYVDVEYLLILVFIGLVDLFLKQNQEWVQVLDGVGVDIMELFFDLVMIFDMVGYEYQLVFDILQVKQVMVVQVVFFCDVIGVEMCEGVVDVWC